MTGLIGIGPLSSEIALRLNEYSDKLVSFIFDDLNIKGNMEDYEREFDSIPDGSAVDSVYCIVDGYLPICGITLKVLSGFQGKPISVFFLTKPKSLMSNEEKKINKICINVMQEYSRSGMFKHMFIIDHEHLWNGILEDSESENKTLNELKMKLVDKICWSVYMYQQMCHARPIDGSILDFTNTIYRISTFFDVGKDDNIFTYYPLKFGRSFSYIITLPEKLNKDDLNLIKKFKNKAKESSENCEIYFSIFNDEQRAIIGLCSTNIIQESGYINKE